MNISKESRAKLLFASMWSALSLGEIMRHTRIDYDHFGFHGGAVRTSQGNIRLYSGVFYASGAMSSAAPFSIAFFNGQREDTNLYQMSLPFHRGNSRASVLTYLSILDFLADTGEITHTVEEYIARLTDGGRYTTRTQYAAEYSEFKAKAIKSLPYDLSLEFLGEQAA